MIFIFGYQPVNKSIGPVHEVTCPNCHHQKHWLLKKTTYYISLFFLPVIPIKTDLFISCPICKFNKPLTREEFKQQEKLAVLNSDAVNNNMEEAEYKNRLKNI